jgi:hypothetical protein
MLQHFTMTYDVDMPRARWCFWIGFVSVVMMISEQWSREARVSKPWVSTLPTFTMEPVKLVPTGLIWLAMAPLLVSVSTSWATRLYHLNQASAAQLVLNHIILWHVEDGLIQPLCWDASRGFLSPDSASSSGQTLAGKSPIYNMYKWRFVAGKIIYNIQ